MDTIDWNFLKKKGQSKCESVLLRDITKIHYNFNYQISLPPCKKSWMKKWFVLCTITLWQLIIKSFFPQTDRFKKFLKKIFIYLFLIMRNFRLKQMEYYYTHFWRQINTRVRIWKYVKYIYIYIYVCVKKKINMYIYISTVFF